MALKSRAMLGENVGDETGLRDLALVAERTPERFRDQPAAEPVWSFGNAPGIKRGAEAALAASCRRQSAALLEGLLDPNDCRASPKPGGVQRQRGYVQQGLAERRLLGLLPLREISWHNATVALRVNSFHRGVAPSGSGVPARATAT